MLTKAEAVEAMKRGVTITHTNFCRSEWMTMRGNKIEFEDGVSCSEQEFWRFRVDDGWDDGYSIWQGGAE